jgi:polysaccharide export outer membrane protein
MTDRRRHMPQEAAGPHRPTRRAVLAAASLCLAGSALGCAAAEKHRNKKVPHLGEYDPAQPRELNKIVLPPYVVEPPDELEIRARPAAVDLPVTNTIVRPDGVIDLDYYGEVLVTGLTIPQLELKLASHLAACAAQKGITEPIQVSVRLVSGGRSKQYYVIGTVQTPGAYPITGNETVLDAIMKAGLRSNSLPEKAYLSRPQPGGAPDQVLRIDWERITVGDTLTNYQLMPGDRVVVPGGRAPGLWQTLFGG